MSAQLTNDEVRALIDAADRAKEDRATKMPDNAAALRAMFSAWQRLKELGWREAIYCPKDGTVFDAIEAGSTGIFDGWYDGEWPNGHWWISDGGETHPAHPILFRLKASK